MISSTKHTTQYNTIFNILLFLLQYYFSSPDIYYLLLIFNYFFLLSPWFLYFILLNFITSSSTLLHLRFAFLIVRNFYFFYQYQCGNASSQVLSLKFLSTIFFLSCTGIFVHFISFHFFFSFWGFLVYRMQICFSFKNNFFLSTNFMPTESWISAGIYRNTPKHPKKTKMSRNFSEVE